MLLFVIVGIFLLVIIGGGVFVFKELKKTNDEIKGGKNTEKIKTAQEFLPFETINHDMIELGAYKYRMVLDVSSINYYLRTEQEKQIIEGTYQRFLNSLTFPISIYIQTKSIDSTEMLNSLENDIRDTVEAFPSLENYAERYFEDMQNLNDHIQNTKQKKKYIIIPYEDAGTMNGLSHEDKKDYSYKELLNRVRVIQDGLSSIGIKTKLLNNEELVELLYSAYNKTSTVGLSAINNEFLEMMVSGENKEAGTPNEKLDWLLYETQQKLQVDLLHPKIDEHTRNMAQEAIYRLSQAREELVMDEEYYKENFYIKEEKDDGKKFSKQNRNKGKGFNFKR